MSADHIAAEAARMDLYERSHLQTGTLDTSGFGEASLAQVALVYRDPTERIEVAIEPFVEPESTEPATTTPTETEDTERPADEDTSNSADQEPDHEPGQDSDDATASGGPDQPGDNPPVVEEPNAAKEQPQVTGRGARRTKAAG